MALFGMANVPFVYVSVNYWRTLHPKTSVVPDARRRACAARSGSASLRSSSLYVLLLTLRKRLEDRQATVEQLYLALED